MHDTISNNSQYIGLMSGTSLDGVDGVLVALPPNGSASGKTLASAHIPFSASARAELMALQSAGENEIHREALAANMLVQHYAECVAELLKLTGQTPGSIRGIGAHGQTIRHRPESGYTRQINNPALLVELTGIDVIADFRSRDIAAGGQGAPLVPAFHQALFGSTTETRVVANIGGMSNISVLAPDGLVIGFDTGPGNVLMDAWVAQHHGKSYDTAGAWAAGGHVDNALLSALRSEDFFALPPPKSTGRDLFDAAWLSVKLAPFPTLRPGDVQATLAAFTATTLADAISAHGQNAQTVYVCGGGAYNTHLMQQLRQALVSRKQQASVCTTETLGVSPNHVEALAFAWLAHRHVLRQPGNLPSVTGAQGLRILGALYPA
jgi:anhydro-N-acetylmuramic acid kinase